MNANDRDEALTVLRTAMPVASAPYALPERSGLLIIDVVDGFCTPMSGPLAPQAPDESIDRMVRMTDEAARLFVSTGRPVFAVRDEHFPGRAEPPYPPHCERGSGQELLVESLRWLLAEPLATVVPKDCISAAVGTWDGRTNALHEWITANSLESIVLVGICTDICIADAAVALLSSRNHYVEGASGAQEPMLGALRDVVAYEPACATYDLPRHVASGIGLPETAIHPQALAHHMGLYVMQSRGAVIASHLT